MPESWTVRLPCRSSWIAATSYASNGDGSGELTLCLHDGRRLVYYRVPYWLRGLLHSGSAGKAFNRLIRPHYECRSIPGPDPAEPRDRLSADLELTLECITHGTSLAELSRLRPTGYPLAGSTWAQR